MDVIGQLHTPTVLSKGHLPLDKALYNFLQCYVPSLFLGLILFSANLHTSDTHILGLRS
jgi:hypothetical protein